MAKKIEKPYTDEELSKFIEETYSWVNEHPRELMRLVAEWVDKKYRNQKNQKL